VTRILRTSPLWLPIVIGLCGCNAILGIEKSKIVSRDDGGPSVCEEGSCPIACSSDEQCDADAGATCVSGTCMAPDTGADGDAGDGGADTTSDSGCTEGELRCEGAALPTRLQCTGGMWKSATSCSDGQLCDSQAKTPGECKPVIEKCLGQKPNQGFCVGAERVICGPDLVSASSKTCGTSTLCSMGDGAECAACMAKDARCDGDKLLLCKPDFSGFAETETCKPGECRANLARCTSMICDPDAYSCEGKLLQRCNNMGSGYVQAETKDCGTGSCDALHGQCDVCEENANLGCADSASQSICAADGQSKTTRACSDLSPTTPTCVGAGVCVQCAPNSKSCTDPRMLVTCSSQGLPSSSQCTGTTCVKDKGCTGECAPMQGKCAGPASAGRSVCGPDGMYIASEACAMGSLCDSVSGQCRPIIDGCMGHKAGDAVCVSETRIVCGPDLVSAVSTDLCGSADLCAASSGGTCAKCTDTTYECRGTELWGCNTARTALERKETCATADLCKPALGKCTSQVCEANKYYCAGTGNNTLQRCNADGSAYLAGTSCGTGICDATNGQCDMCRGATYTGCSGANSRLRCADDGQSTAPEACPTGTPLCTGTGRCVQCTGNSCSVDLKTAYSCTDGVQTNTLCPADRTCVSAACGGVCGPGQYQCPNAESPARQVCGAQGTFVATTACASGSNCERATGTCKPIIAACAGHKEGDWVCSGQDRIQCGRDLLSIAASGQHCASAALCGAGSGQNCAPCADGVTPDRCNQAQPERCSGNTWVAKGAACASAVWCGGAGVCSNPNCQPGSWHCKADGKGHEQCNAMGTGYDTNMEVCGWCNPASPSGCAACQPGALGPTCASGTAQSTCNASGTGFTASQACGPSPRTTCTTGNTCVQCTASSCQNAGTLNQCSGGLLSSVPCGATQTCIADANPRCGGSCRAGTFQCNTTTKNPETCLSTGVWQQTATCNTPSQICTASASASSCATNAAYNIGDSMVDSSWGDLFTLENAIYFRPIVASRLATLQFLRLVGHAPAGDTSGMCQMAIYTDSGGRPGTLLTWTSSNVPVIDGVGGAAPSSSAIQLNGTYWVAAECFHPSGSATLRAKAVAGAEYLRGSHTFGTDFPTTWPVNMGTRVTGTALAFFLQVQNVP
jgi:hypothetical protein